MYMVKTPGKLTRKIEQYTETEAINKFGEDEVREFEVELQKSLHNVFSFTSDENKMERRAMSKAQKVTSSRRAREAEVSSNDESEEDVRPSPKKIKSNSGKPSNAGSKAKASEKSNSKSDSQSQGSPKKGRRKAQEEEEEEVEVEPPKKSPTKASPKKPKSPVKPPATPGEKKRGRGRPPGSGKKS